VQICPEFLINIAKYSRNKPTLSHGSRTTWQSDRELDQSQTRLAYVTHGARRARVQAFLALIYNICRWNTLSIRKCLRVVHTPRELTAARRKLSFLALT